MSTMIDLTGQTFGRLTVLARLESNGTKAYWRCHCECGRETRVRSTHLRSGQTRSCGCLRRRHGHSAQGQLSDTYTTWRSMHQRCKPNHRAHKWYADRGISVCERWGSFNEFLKDMGERPAGTTLDRIDPDDGYHPGNCRWATSHEQAANRRPRGADEPSTAKSSG